MRFSKDVIALNPILQDKQIRQQANGQEDCADLLLAQMRVHGRDLAPLFVREHPFDRWRIDLAHVDRKIAVEVNGGYSNARGGKHATKNDHRKIRMLTRAGWQVYVFTAGEVRADPLGVIDEIRGILES